MGGRKLQKKLFSTFKPQGASMTFEQATQRHVQWLAEYGMSEKLGPVHARVIMR